MVNFRGHEFISSVRFKLMKRNLQILGLMVLAFAASGWGYTVAAALCPHARASQAPAAVQKLNRQPECHHEMAMNGEERAESRPSPALPERRARGSALSLPENLPCTHCMGSSEAPASTTTTARPQLEQKRGPDLLPANVSSPPAQALSFRQPVPYRQGAPPGAAAPRHLLIGLLLI